MAVSASLSTDRATSRLASWLRPMLVGLALFVVAALVWRAGLRATLEAVGQAGWGTLAIVLAPAGGLLLHCLGWLVLLPPSLRPRLRFAFLTYVAAQAGDELGLGIAGEPLKILVQPRRLREASAAAVALDNLAQVLALGCFLLFIVPGLCLVLEAAPPAKSLLLASVGAALIAASLVVLLFLTGHARGHRVSRHRLLERCRTVIVEARAAWRANPRPLVHSVFLHLLGKSWIVVEMALALLVLGARPRLAFWLAPWSVLASLVGAPVPGQLGAVEAALVASGSVAGIAPATIMALALLRRLRTVFWLAVGFLVVRKVLAHGREA